jgi:hypothetical protein
MSRPGHNIAEILLKVLLNTITIAPHSTIFILHAVMKFKDIDEIKVAISETL